MECFVIMPSPLISPTEGSLLHFGGLLHIQSLITRRRIPKEASMAPFRLLLCVSLLFVAAGCAPTNQARSVEPSGFLGDLYPLMHKGAEGEALLLYRNAKVDSIPRGTGEVPQMRCPTSYRNHPIRWAAACWAAEDDSSRSGSFERRCQSA